MSPPPAFVGRAEAIADIESAARLAWRPGLGHGMPGATRILQGAPGAGKSSILAELESRCLAAPLNKGMPRVLAVSSTRLAEDRSSVLASIAAVGRMPINEWANWATRLTGRLSASVGFAGMTVESARSNEEAPSHLFALAAATPPEAWDAPVIIAVDEAQNLPPDARSPHALLLQEIHNAEAGLPLTLVLAGLGDTLDRARELGLTRGLRQHEAGQLAEDESQALMEGFCKRFGLRTSGCGMRLADLAAPAQGWPRHLHFALQALGEEALAEDGDLEKIDWNRAEARAAHSRLRYYRGQRTAAMEAGECLVGAVMSDLVEGMSRMEIIDLIATKASSRFGWGWALPSGYDPENFLQLLTHQGALQRRTDSSYYCPIPSFRNFLIQEGAKRFPRG